MIVDFKFKLGDIVYIKWQGSPRGKIVERKFEYIDRIHEWPPMENACYKVELLEDYDPQKIMLPNLLSEDWLFSTEKEAANEVLRENGFSLRF